MAGQHKTNTNVFHSGDLLAIAKRVGTSQILIEPFEQIETKTIFPFSQLTKSGESLEPIFHVIDQKHAIFKAYEPMLMKRVMNHIKNESNISSDLLKTKELILFLSNTLREAYESNQLKNVKAKILVRLLEQSSSNMEGKLFKYGPGRNNLDEDDSEENDRKKVSEIREIVSQFLEIEIPKTSDYILTASRIAKLEKKEDDDDAKKQLQTFVNSLCNEIVEDVVELIKTECATYKQFTEKLCTLVIALGPNEDVFSSALSCYIISGKLLLGD